MKLAKQIVIVFLFMVVANLAHGQGSAATSVTVKIDCNNRNFETSAQCTAPVDWFLGDRENGFYGQLTSGVTFRQGPILSDRGVFLHKITIEDAFWYLDEKGSFFAESDLQALSVHVTRI